MPRRRPARVARPGCSRPAGIPRPGNHGHGFRCRGARRCSLSQCSLSRHSLRGRSSGRRGVRRCSVRGRGIGIAETIDDLAALFAVLGNGEGREGEWPGVLNGGEGGAGGEPGIPGGEGGAGGEPGIPGGEGAARGQPGTFGGEGGERGRPGGLGPAQHPGHGPSADPPLRLICAIAEGWTEESLDQLGQGGCEDPLSGLATLAHLRTRLAELYREAEHRGTSPADTHRLLVVGLPSRPDPWGRMALAILVGHDLRAAFPGGETLSLAKPGPAIALVCAHGDLPLRYARLRRNIQATFGTQIRMTPLPGVLTDALRLVDDLAR